MKRLALVLLPIFAVFLMSHNASAATRLGNYTNYVSGGVSGLPLSWQYNRDTNITASGTGSSYVANGQFGWNLDWEEGQEYVLTLSISLNASANNGIVGVLNPEPMNIQGSNYHSTSDTITMSKDCPSTTNCKTVLMHEIKIIATGTGSEAIKTPNSNLVNMSDFISTNSGSAIISWSGMRFDSYDEWASFKNSVESELSDQTDLLQGIYDRLDALDNNADANAEAWDNMQNTDGLVDIGDTTQLLSIVGVITTVFDSIKNAPMSESCSIDANFNGLFGEINPSLHLGAINLCYTLPSWVSEIGTFVMTTITFVAVLFMLIGCVNAINKYMDWLRHN